MINFDEAQSRFDKALNHFKDELGKLRVGRPTPEMFNEIPVEAYGSTTNLQSVANISIVDATLVTVQPWDKNLLEDVNKAIQQTNKFNPQIADQIIRIPIPSMTQEKRQESVKLIHEMAEEARIQVRVIRKDVLAYLDSQKESGNLTEDEQHKKEDKLQDMVDAVNEKIEELAEKKEESIMKI